MQRKSWKSHILTDLRNKKVEKKEEMKIFKLILSLLSCDVNLADEMMSHFYLYYWNSLAKSGTAIKYVPELPHNSPILNG